MSKEFDAWVDRQKREAEAFYRRTTREIEDEKQRLVAKGRQAYRDSAHLAGEIRASTEAELVALGRKSSALLPRSAPIPTRTRAQAPAARPTKPLPSRTAADAVLGGFSDGATFGLVDKGLAAARAQPFQVGWGERYKANLAIEHAQDAYDQEQHPLARTGGEVAGAVGTMAVTGPIGADIIAPRLAVRLAPKAATFLKGALATEREAPLARGVADHLRWSGVAAGSGATVGVGTQAATDLIVDHRLRSPKKYLATGLGSASEGAAMLYAKPRNAGAFGGSVAAATEDFLDGHFPSAAHVAEGARDGALMGQIGDAIGTLGAHRLPGQAKTKMTPKRAAELYPNDPDAQFRALVPKLDNKQGLGERLSELRSIIELEGVGARQQRRPLSKSYTDVDHVTKTDRPVEAKFGYAAKLRKPQKLAQQELDGYRVDHFLPRDIGRAFGGFGSQIAIGLGANRRDR